MTDREKVIKGLEIHTKPNSRCIGCPYPNNGLCGDQLYIDALTLLKEQKHGHWVFDPDGIDWNIPAWCCSECHCRNYNIPPNIEKVNPLRWEGSKFCPNCGAKMDEEVKQDGMCCKC